MCIEKDNSRIKPNYIELDTFKEIKLICQSSKSEVLWFFSILNELPKNVNNIGTSKNLTIELSDSVNSGYYYCYGHTKLVKSGFWAEARVQVLGMCVK